MSLSAHTQAAVDLLNSAGVPTGRGKAPEGVGWAGAPGQSAFTAYAIVWRVGGKDVASSDLDRRWDLRKPQIHVRTVGGTPAEADDLLDDANAAFQSTPLDVDGFSNVHLIYDTSIATARDDDVTPPLYYTGAYWRFWTQEQP